MNEPSWPDVRTDASARSSRRALRRIAATPRSFLEAIAAGPLVLDAGMGTRLMALGLDPRSDDPALWNLSRPAECWRFIAATSRPAPTRS